MDINAIAKELAVDVESAASLDELEARLRSRRDVKSVELMDYLLKSFPPQREFIVEFTAPDGSSVPAVVNVFDLGDGRFRFNELRTK